MTRPDPRLLAHRELLIRQLAQLGVETATLHGDAQDIAVASTQADATMDRRAFLTASLRAIDRAIERSAAGTYGMCVDCDVAIAPKRLAAMPFTERCVRCQARYEEQRGRREFEDAR